MQPKFEDLLKCECSQCQELEVPECFAEQPCGICTQCEDELALEEAGLAEAGWEYDRATGRVAS